MIIIHYQGRLGNNVFQYAFARVLSLILNQPIQNHLDTINSSVMSVEIPVNEPVNTPLPKVCVIDDSSCLKTIELSNKKFLSDHNIILRGYFQNPLLYKGRHDFLRSFLKPNPSKHINTDDGITIHIRMDDYNHHGKNPNIINFCWYKDIIDKLPVSDKIYLIVDSRRDTNYKIRFPWANKMEDFYIGQFEKMYPGRITLLQNTDIEDFNTMLHAKKLIPSFSTFSFWAAFLNNRDDLEIYAPNLSSTTIDFSVMYKNPKIIQATTWGYDVNRSIVLNNFNVKLGKMLVHLNEVYKFNATDRKNIEEVFVEIQNYGTFLKERLNASD